MNGDSAPGGEARAHAPDGVLEVHDVTVRFGGLTALDGVSLTVAPHQIVGVIGPNGAGKTTLFNVLCGFVRPESGSLVWDGRPLRRLRPHRLASLGIARTLQGLGLFSRLTVVENVMVGATRRAGAGFGSALLGLPKSDRDERALRADALQTLSELGAADYAGRLPGQLPYGVRKRVALARALVARPRLLLLDEPASGLSETEINELGDLLRSRRTELSIVVVEHHMDLVMAVCDPVVVLDFGRVITSGSPNEVRDDPAVTAAYLGEVARPGTAPGAEAHDG